MKVLPFFGSDLDAQGAIGLLQGAVREGYTLVPLDSDAMAFAFQSGSEYSVFEDWVDAESIADLKETAAQCELGWYEGAKEEFTADGVCWPEIDHVAMGRFWQDALAALIFADALNMRGVRAAITFSRNFPRASVFSDPSDICSAVWQATLQCPVKVIKRRPSLTRILSRTSLGSSFARLSGLVFKSSGKTSKCTATVQAKSVVLVLGRLEALRLSHVAQELARAFPGRTAAVSGGPYVWAAEEVASKLEVPAIVGAPWPLAPTIPMPLVRGLALVRSTGYEKRFLAAYERAATLAKGKPWERILRLLRFHFEYYCVHRWPALHARTLESWLELWKAVRPMAVLVTNVWTSYYLSACVAAKRLDIPCFLIGHGGVQILPSNMSSLFLVDRVFYETPLQRQIYMRAGVSEAKLAECRGIIAWNEYPVSKIDPWSSTLRWRILALLGPTDDGRHLVHQISLKAQTTALRALASIPSEISSRIDLALKVHPFYHDMGIINAAGSGLSEKVLPPESDLHQLIQDSHLVIAVNYVGSALIHVFRAGKPVVYFQTEAKPITSLPSSYGDLFTDGCEVITSAEEFWMRLTHIISESELMTQLAMRSKAFGEKNLMSSAAPTLAESIQRLLA